MSRPEGNEAEATHRAIALADQVNVPLYIVHVMSRSASDVIARAKVAGVRVWGEALAVGLAKDGRDQYHKDWVRQRTNEKEQSDRTKWWSERKRDVESGGDKK